MKRVISLFAALLVLLPLSTTACSNDNAKTGTDMGAGTSAGLSETAAESEAKLEIPDYDRQGEVFTILTGEYMKEKTQTFFGRHRRRRYAQYRALQAKPGA